MSDGEISWAMESTWTCPACGEPNVLKVWPILSTLDQPALVERLASTGLLGSPCRKCGRNVEPDHPVLVHRADRWGSGVLAYSPVSPAIAPIETAMSTGENLATLLMGNLGMTDASQEVLIVMVPRVALPDLLVRDVQADVRTPPGQLVLPGGIAESYSHALRRLRQRAGYE